MIEPRLQRDLSALEFMLRRTRLWRRLAWCWGLAAGFGVLLYLLGGLTDWISPALWWIPFAAGAGAAFVIWIQEQRRPRDLPALVATLESQHPELRHLLSAAIEQQPDPASGRFHFLQLRVIDEVLRHPDKRSWNKTIRAKLLSSRNRHALAICAMIGLFLLSYVPFEWNWRQKPRRTIARFTGEIEVTPGDAQIERGSGLVIAARFGGTPPADATLVMVSASGETKQLPLERHLADPVFGASLMEITENQLYHVEYGSKRTRDFRIDVFDYPALTRADAHLEFPGYTGLTNRTVRDTRRVSAVEGTRLTYTMQLNKPVARARLVSPDATLDLITQSNGLALLNGLVLTNSGRYLLELTDAEGRTNRFRTEFVLQVMPDRVPELKIVFPRGDPRVSLLEELQIQAEAQDDFGILKYGIGLSAVGQEPQFVELGERAAGNEKRQFTHMVPLESLKMEVDQVLSYFAWADDYGPDGEVRRTFSDVFFAEVRPFEEIYRRDQSGMDGQEQSQQQQGMPGGGNERTRLAELQKQIVIATWKLQREKTGMPPKVL